MTTTALISEEYSYMVQHIQIFRCCRLISSWKLLDLEKDADAFWPSRVHVQSGWMLKVRIPVVTSLVACEGAGWQQAAAPLPGGIPQTSWTGAELQPADVTGDSEVSDLCLERLHNQMFHVKYDVMFLHGRSHQFQRLHAHNSILFGFMLENVVVLPCLCCRTLLALGCHVGLADEHAVDKVKSMKLSAT